MKAPAQERWEKIRHRLFTRAPSRARTRNSAVLAAPNIAALGAPNIAKKIG